MLLFAFFAWRLPEIGRGYRFDGLWGLLIRQFFAGIVRRFLSGCHVRLRFEKRAKCSTRRLMAIAFLVWGSFRCDRLWCERSYFFERPHMVAYSSFHCRSDTQRLVHTSEVVVHEVDR